MIYDPVTEENILELSLLDSMAMGIYLSDVTYGSTVPEILFSFRFFISRNTAHITYKK